MCIRRNRCGQTVQSSVCFCRCVASDRGGRLKDLYYWRRTRVAVPPGDGAAGKSLCAGILTLYSYFLEQNSPGNVISKKTEVTELTPCCTLWLSLSFNYQAQMSSSSYENRAPASSVPAAAARLHSLPKSVSRGIWVTGYICTGSIYTPPGAATQRWRCQHLAL